MTETENKSGYNYSNKKKFGEESNNSEVYCFLLINYDEKRTTFLILLLMEKTIIIKCNDSFLIKQKNLNW